MAVLHHIGLNEKHQGLFKGMTYEQALEALRANPEYDEVRGYLDSSFTSDDIGRTVDELLCMDKEVLATVRTKQYQFRREVLDAYDSKCCITGISNPLLLRASHIKPWRDSTPQEKISVHNGLCLNALHDSAFDKGLIAVDPVRLVVILSPELMTSMPPEVYQMYFKQYEGKPISVPHPDKKPSKEFLQYHLDNIFRG